MNFETLAVHAAKQVDTATGAIVPPLHLSTTYARDESQLWFGQELRRRFLLGGRFRF